VPKREKRYEYKVNLGKDIHKVLRKSFSSTKSFSAAKKKAEEYWFQSGMELCVTENSCAKAVKFLPWALSCLEMYKKPYVKANTYGGTYLAPMKKHLIPHFGNMNINDIQQYINKAAKKYAPEAIKGCNVLKLIFETAEESQSIHINQGLVVYHSADEDKLAMENNGLENKFWRRIIPITDDDLWERLRQSPRTVTLGKKTILTEQIFHSPEGKPYQLNNWESRVYRRSMRALHNAHPEVPELSPHELRNTRATLWIAQGMDPYMVASAWTQRFEDADENLRSHQHRDFAESSPFHKGDKG